jgi:spore photoproduct lyase
VIREHGWENARRRMGMGQPIDDPALFLGVMRWDGKFDERARPIREACPEFPHGLARAMLGYDAFVWFQSHTKKLHPCRDHVCRPAWRIHLMNGCPHRCFYCSFGRVLTMMMNHDEYIEKLDELVERNPWQETYLYEDDAEALALEPEYGAMRVLVEYFAAKPDRYTIVHTKSANVDFLKDIDHGGHTILVWSLTPRTQSEVMEPKCGTMEERIEAARKCREWGYTVRYKFKPIVPVKGWADEIAEMVRLLFERSEPDVISLFVLAWMKVSELTELCDTSLLDPEFLQAALGAAPEMANTRVAPFPHELRKRVYRHCLREIRRYNKHIPVTLSTETLQMWRELGPELGYSPADYPCGCGPQAIPHRRRLPHSPWAVAKPRAVS